MADGSKRKPRNAYQREWARKWRAEHPEEARKRAREASRKRRAQKPEADRADRALYRERHRDELLEKGRERVRRRAPLKDQMRLRHGVNWRTAFDAFWKAQEGRCYLCGDPIKFEVSHDTVIDHSHDCCPQRKSCEVCRRGLACGRCNRLVGLAGESAERLRRIADALDAADRLVRERLAGQPVQPTLFDEDAAA